jgi:hypothetical protein
VARCSAYNYNIIGGKNDEFQLKSYESQSKSHEFY